MVWEALASYVYPSGVKKKPVLAKHSFYVGSKMLWSVLYEKGNPSRNNPLPEAQNNFSFRFNKKRREECFGSQKFAYSFHSKRLKKAGNGCWMCNPYGLLMRCIFCIKSASQHLFSMIKGLLGHPK